jgi:hypothetical protein
MAPRVKPPTSADGTIEAQNVTDRSVPGRFPTAVFPSGGLDHAQKQMWNG